MDSINKLPDELLGKILSFLPTRVAASTSVMSKRWRNLLPYVENLDFDDFMPFCMRDDNIGEKSTSFSNFVDKTLAFSSRIKKFFLKRVHEDDGSRVNRWIRTALERGCVDLTLKYSGVELLVDSALCTSNKLVKLAICDGFFSDVRFPCGGAFLPSLKNLFLVSSSFNMINFFTHGCPKLEELVIRLLLGLSSFKHKTPSLNDSTYGYCNVSDSLAKATLDIRVDRRDVSTNFLDETYGNVNSLIKKISNVKTLHLSHHSLDVFSFCSSSLVFDNLIRLSIECDEEKSWQVMPHLLDNSPNLQNLIIKGLVHKVAYWCGDMWCGPCRDASARTVIKNKEKECCLSRCRVKVLEISGYKGNFRELKQMRHFLGKLKDLETVKVGIEEDMDNLRASLMALPRASSKCKIQLI